MIVGEIEKNTRERIRISIEDYRGHRFIDCRVYFEDNSGTWKPTKKGVALNRESIDKVVEILKNAAPLLRGQ